MCTFRTSYLPHQRLLQSIFLAFQTQLKGCLLTSPVSAGPVFAKDNTAQPPTHGKEVVILTGVTGTLGVHIFDVLRMSDRVGEIHCLIRGADQNAAEQRLVKALEHKKLPGIKQSKAEVHCHVCKLHHNEKLGLEENVYLVSRPIARFRLGSQLLSSNITSLTETQTSLSSVPSVGRYPLES